MRKTKIVCTIGPACSSEEVLEQMCLAGMNVARLNFSHGTHEQHKENIDKIKRVREKLHLPIAILLDTKGPEYRIRTFEEGKVTLAAGDHFRFYGGEERIGNREGVSVSYPNLAEDTLNALVQEYRRRFDELVSKEPPARFPGVDLLLDELKKEASS